MKKRVGRKPRGEFHGKSAVFSTRITPETRAGLEREAHHSGRSLSQEIERRLKDSLRSPKDIFGLEKEHNQALAILIGNLADRVEMTTGQPWNRDRFTFEALIAACQIVLNGLAPAGDAVMPKEIAEQVRRVPGSVAVHLEKPEGLAAACALGLLTQLRQAMQPPAKHFSPIYFTDFSDAGQFLPWAREKLGPKGETQ